LEKPSLAVAVLKKGKCVHHRAVQFVVALKGKRRQQLGYDAAVVVTVRADPYPRIRRAERILSYATGRLSTDTLPLEQSDFGGRSMSVSDLVSCAQRFAPCKGVFGCLNPVS
jgi:hypothetical protein